MGFRKCQVSRECCNVDHNFVPLVIAIVSEVTVTDSARKTDSLFEFDLFGVITLTHIVEASVVICSKTPYRRCLHLCLPSLQQDATQHQNPTGVKIQETK